MVVIAECAADVEDALDQAVVGYSNPRPDGLHKFFLADQPICIFDQIPQHRKSLRPQSDDIA